MGQTNRQTNRQRFSGPSSTEVEKNEKNLEKKYKIEKIEKIEKKYFVDIFLIISYKKMKKN